MAYYHNNNKLTYSIDFCPSASFSYISFQFEMTLKDVKDLLVKNSNGKVTNSNKEGFRYLFLEHKSISLGSSIK